MNINLLYENSEKAAISMAELKVLTLNCWGVPTPIACKLRQPRMEAIGSKLGEGEHDVVILEEVWDKGDYSLLKQKMGEAYPHTHYFYSGAIGSGVCVFSKVPILETFYYRFSLNGYAHKIQHGDWFGGKGVGMCKISFKGFRVCLFCTHIHASYNVQCDEYIAHRVSQAFEMSQFIKLLANKHNCDVVITAGDFNLTPADLGYKILRSNAQLLDSWLEKNHEESNIGMTCDTPSNSFTKPSKSKEVPDGQRLDYVLFRYMSGTKVTVKDCCVTMGKVPGQTYNYSDHEGVAVVFMLQKAMEDERREAITGVGQRSLLQAAQLEIDKGMKKASSDSMFYTILAVMSVFLLYLLSSVEVPYGLGLFRGFLIVALTLLFGFCVWHKAIISRIENHGLKATQLDIQNRLNSAEKDSSS